MKKKIILALCLAAIMCLASSCMMVPGSKLEAMFGQGKISTPETASGTSASQDTVTVSREEYEEYLRLKKFSELAELYDNAVEMFYQEPDTQQMLDYSAEGLMAGLGDPYSFYYTPEEFAKMFEEDEGEYVGIGVSILSDVTTGICVISRVFRGSPAEAAGVQRGDILYRVEDDLYVTPENINEAVSIMRGQQGTTVDVTFLRNGEEITYTILRDNVTINWVESTMLDEEIGYIALYEFSGEVELQFEKDLKDLTARGAKGIIIDLRDNRGGWVEQARYIADLFMDSGEICHLVFRNGETQTYDTKNGKTDVKLVLVVNEMSASSSEILAGALRECADATIVGTTTFGKGIVQSVLPVGDRGAGFQITIAEYFSPKGNKVHGVGITPDIEIERPEQDTGTYDFADVGNDIQLKTALDTMRDKLNDNR